MEKKQRIVLDMRKSGEKLRLNLKKEELFTAIISWEGEIDLDLHALLCINHGEGAKVEALEDVLSTFNVKRKIGRKEVGTLDLKSDGSFEIYGGALIHSPDVTDGDDKDAEESITINPALLPDISDAAYEILIIATTYSKNSKELLRFKDAKNARIVVKDSDGEEVMEAILSDEFGNFSGVQTGSFFIDDEGTRFLPVGKGFVGNFNDVLQECS